MTRTGAWHSCDLLLFKSPLNWWGSFIWVHSPKIICLMYSPSQLLTIQSLIYESPRILLMYCWYMHACQLCVIYAGITIDARTGHMLVELHYWVDLYLDITSSPPPIFWRQDWYSYISTRELGLTQIQLDIIALQVLRLTTTPGWSQLQQQLTQPGLVEVNKLIMSKSGTTAAATNSG